VCCCCFADCGAGLKRVVGPGIKRALAEFAAADVAAVGIVSTAGTGATVMGDAVSVLLGWVGDCEREHGCGCICDCEGARVLVWRLGDCVVIF